MSTGPSTKTGFRWEMEAPGKLRLGDFALEAPGPGQALVRVVGCGVCHTDLGFLHDGVLPRAPLPLALGHEISGVVEEIDPAWEHLLGCAVIVPAVTPCGSCTACRTGRGALCARQIMPGNDVPGGFASHVVVPARGLCPVEDPAARSGRRIGRSGCTLAELSVLADAVTTPFQAVQRAGVEAGDFAVVVGLGGVGGFCAQIARAQGATVVGFDVDPGRLALLAEHGLALGVDPRGRTPKDLRAELRAFARQNGHSEMCWKIFECSGSRAGQELAWGLLGPGAWLSVVGYTLDRIEVRLSNLMAFDATAAGNWGCLPELYPQALALVLAGRVQIAPFVELHPLSEIESVLSAVHEHRITRRPVLVP